MESAIIYGGALLSVTRLKKHVALKAHSTWGFCSSLAPANGSSRLQNVDNSTPATSKQFTSQSKKPLREEAKQTA
jgi:hypothetical protein